MKRTLLLIGISIILYSCSDKNRSNTSYTFILDHYSTEVERNITDILSVEDYSPCPKLASSTFKSKLIRYDLVTNNEANIIRKSLIQRLLPSRITPKRHNSKISKFSIPTRLRKEQAANQDPKNLEFFLNSFNPGNTRVFGLNSIGLQYKNLQLTQSVKHFRNIFDLKDALSDYVCNDINVKNTIILVNLFDETGVEDCLARCEILPEKIVCADDGNRYRNVECMKCYSNLQEIPCNQRIPVFSKEMLTERAFEIFYQFSDAQNLISNNKNTPIAEDLIENTLRLFDGGNKKIEILNLGTQRPTQFSTEQYLKRLLNRPFDEVAVEWDRDWTVVQEWTDADTEIPESRMSAEGKQYFKGYRKNLVAYSDVIKKNVTFQAKLVETIDSEGNEVLEWKVLIGDITIASQPTEL